MRPLVRAAALSGYIDVNRALGLDPQALLTRVGLPAEPVARLLELSAAMSGCEDFGVRMAERRRFANLGPISLVMRSSWRIRAGP